MKTETTTFPLSPLQRIRVALRWRYREARSTLLQSLGLRETHWARVVMDRETERLVRSMPAERLDVLEISGSKWETFGFRTYRSADYPEYDVCEAPLKTGAFDLVIAEQVLEHVLWPYRAVRNIYQMLRPGGVFLATTPFLIRIHNYPVDCSRWTELGLKHLLAECGFELKGIATGSWGNIACVKANFRRWANWVKWKHSLHNNPEFPIVVWAFARKSCG